MVFSIFFCSSIVTVVLSAESGGGMFSGNVGLYGNGFGDVYAGKIKEGVYGAGVRFGGNIGVTGTGGFGRKRREVGMNAAGTDAKQERLAPVRQPATAIKDTTDRPRTKKFIGDRKKRQTVVAPSNPRSVPLPVMAVDPPQLPLGNIMQPAPSVFLPSLTILPDVRGAYARGSFSFILEPTMTESGEERMVNGTSGTY